MKTTHQSPSVVSLNDGGSSRGMFLELHREHFAALAAKPSENDVPIAISVPSSWQSISRFTSPDGSLHFVVVGHLYARTAASFDITESLQILARSYQRGGIDELLSEIGGGVYALILVDRLKKQLCATCDYLACMPLYYQKSADAFTLGTNQFDFGNAANTSTSACFEYLTYGYLPFTHSLIMGVERLGPGQVITIDLNCFGKVAISCEKLPTYPPVHERQINASDACEHLGELFGRYFDRLGDEATAAGLSGGYDSRLIAAYAAKKNIRLVTFHNPGTAEAVVAKRVANALRLSTEVVGVRSDAPTRYLDDFRGGMQTLDSLEMSHVFSILDSLDSTNPTFLTDGFLGGEVMGSHYYYKLFGGSESLFKVLTAQDRYCRPPAPASEYASRLRTLYGRRLLLPRNSVEQSTIAIARMAEQQHAGCPTDADMIEMLSYRLRTRLVIACGPVSFLRRRHVLLPFYDRDIFEACLSVDKSLRAGDRLYNMFWRRYFPELANIPKESTGGLAKQRVISYRLTHFRTAGMRRIASRLPSWTTRLASAGGDTRSFVHRYCQDDRNRNLLNLPWGAQAKLNLPDELFRFIDLHRDDIMNNQILQLRVASLVSLIS